MVRNANKQSHTIRPHPRAYSLALGQRAGLEPQANSSEDAGSSGHPCNPRLAEPLRGVGGEPGICGHLLSLAGRRQGFRSDSGRRTGCEGDSRPWDPMKPSAQPTLWKSNSLCPGLQRPPQTSEVGSQGLHLTRCMGGGAKRKGGECWGRGNKGGGYWHPAHSLSPSYREGCDKEQRGEPLLPGQKTRGGGGHTGLPASILGRELGAGPVGHRKCS